jgi:hypothetical protein
VQNQVFDQRRLVDGRGRRVLFAEDFKKFDIIGFYANATPFGRWGRTQGIDLQASVTIAALKRAV